MRAKPYLSCPFPLCRAGAGADGMLDRASATAGWDHELPRLPRGHGTRRHRSSCCPTAAPWSRGTRTPTAAHDMAVARYSLLRRARPTFDGDAWWSYRPKRSAALRYLRRSESGAAAAGRPSCAGGRGRDSWKACLRAGTVERRRLSRPDVRNGRRGHHPDWRPVLAGSCNGRPDRRRRRFLAVVAARYNADGSLDPASVRAEWPPCHLGFRRRGGGVAAGRQAGDRREHPWPSALPNSR